MGKSRITLSRNTGVCITYPDNARKKQISHGLISGDRESHLYFAEDRTVITVIEKNKNLDPNCRRADISFSYADIILLFSELMKELRNGYGTEKLADLYSALVEAREEMTNMEDEIEKMKSFWERRRQEG